MDDQPIRIVATLPPYVSHRDRIIRHPLVSELRFNTIMPVAESPYEILRILKEACGDKRLWIDLKARQLRITRFAYLPLAVVELNHAISLDLPAKIRFKDCEGVIVRMIGGRQLILEERPTRIVGDGEPVNIHDDSLKIEELFTLSDLRYIGAARQLGLHHYYFSFFEGLVDLEALLKLDSEAIVQAKIESLKGLDFADQYKSDPEKRLTLLAARDDLYANIGRDKVQMVEALRLIVERDPQATVASKILSSLEDHDEVALADISDLELLYALGYRTFMLSDGLCFHADSFFRAMDVLDNFIDSLKRRGA